MELIVTFFDPFSALNFGNNFLYMHLFYKAYIEFLSPNLLFVLIQTN